MILAIARDLQVMLPVADLLALVKSSVFFTVLHGHSRLSITAGRFTVMFSAVASLLLSSFARRAQSWVTCRGAGVFAAAQKFSANLIAGPSGLEFKIGVDAAQLETFTATVTRPDWT